MPDTYLLEWDPYACPTKSIAKLRDNLLEGRLDCAKWSVGKLKNIEAGSRFFLYPILAFPPTVGNCSCRPDSLRSVRRSALRPRARKEAL